MPPLMRLLFLLIAVTVYGCGDTATDSAPENDQRSTSVSFSIIWQTPDAEDQGLDRTNPQDSELQDCPVQQVQFRVYDEAGGELTRHTWNCSDHGGSINDIQPGLKRQFVVFGLDENDNILYRGQADRDYDCISGDVLDVGYIEANLFVPRLSKPVNGENFKVLNPTLTWDAIVGASKYHVTVSENSDHANPVIQGESTIANFEVAGLDRTKTYHLQVMAADTYGNEGVASEIRAFTVDAITPPDTGQTDSYTETWGEDSDYDINPPRFTKLDNDQRALPADAATWTMVRDETTGLIWEVKTNDDGVNGKDRPRTWQESKDTFIPELNRNQFGGYTNWRLPTVIELSTLIDYGRFAPAINSDYFPNAIPGPAAFWTSIQPTHDDSRPLTRTVYTEYGGSGYSVNTESRYVRAVYSGPDSDSVPPDFEDHGDGTVTDNRTGLMWIKGADLTPISWEQALRYCEKLEFATHQNWRMPNIRELQSIINYNREDAPYYYEAVSKELIKKDDNTFWSSTSVVNKDSLEVWIADLNEGSIREQEKKDMLLPVHPVRSAQ